MYFDLKYLIISLFSPLPICVWILTAGIILLWFTTKQKTGKIFIAIGVLLLFLFSLPLFPNFVLGNLENIYSYEAMKKDIKVNDLKYVVVLAGGFEENSNIPITSKFTYAGLVRLVEGIRLYKRYNNTKLILSGGPGRGSLPEAELMAKLSLELGLPVDDIILETKSRNTYEEATLIKPLVGEDTFLLVTSASHMQRSIALFRKLGMKPVPAPTGHLVKNNEDFFSVIPSGYNLIKSYTVFYEYLGFIKEKLLGRI